MQNFEIKKITIKFMLYKHVNILRKACDTQPHASHTRTPSRDSPQTEIF